MTSHLTCIYLYHFRWKTAVEKLETSFFSCKFIGIHREKILLAKAKNCFINTHNSFLVKQKWRDNAAKKRVGPIIASDTGRRRIDYVPLKIGGVREVEAQNSGWTPASFMKLRYSLLSSLILAGVRNKTYSCEHRIAKKAAEQVL